MYRMLSDRGYTYRLRIYDIERMNCDSIEYQNEIVFDNTFKKAVNTEAKYFNNNNRYSYNGLKDSPDHFFEDFPLKEKSKMTAMHYYITKWGKEVLTYSLYPDFYEFRTLVKEN